jgi:hypothetical protein
MSPFAGQVETPWLNLELSEAAGRSAGGKCLGVSNVYLSCRPAFAHRSCLLVAWSSW